ncbi:MAG: hypothetical protein E4H03_06195 [Myxococcales bacterium]|nr:MAG: hypothetical protein E4H03_06195 [Myxococcales bacterium]
MQSSSSVCRRVRYAGFGIIAVVFFLVAIAPEAHARLKPHCRRLLITGIAGVSPNQATFQILDKNSNTLAQSCAVQPHDNEEDIEYIKRLAYRWTPDPTGGDDDDPCTPVPPFNGALPDPLPKKACVTLAGPDQPSCTIKYKVSPKDTGVKKQYMEFCCYEDNDQDKLCKSKLDAAATPKPIPITLQVDTNGDLTYCPEAPCDGDCPACPIVISPPPPPFTFVMRGPVEPLLGTKHLPSAEGGGCRADLGAALRSYAAVGSSAISRCHKARLAGKLDSATNCNSATDDADTAAQFQVLADGVRSAALGCAKGGSPAASGYGSCPAPCALINIGLCSAGNVGAPCAGDSECDVTPGDGLCGNWTAVGDCLTCLAEDAVVSAAVTTYGDTPVPIPAPKDVANCDDAIAGALVKLTATLVRETAKCQKKTDTGQKSLPAGVSFCKDADVKGIIAKAEASARALIVKSCSGGEIPVLASICGGALDPDSVGDCVVENAHAVNETISGAAYPDTAAVCGNGNKEGGEQCDGANDTACPGVCLSSCQCGLLSPVSEDLTPCEPGSVDRYTFPVQAGDTLSVRADTVDAGTAADLCFGAGSGCDNGDAIEGDDEVPCTFPSPLGFGCPHATFSATADGVCTVEVAECINDCANAAQANYTLSVQKAGGAVPLQLTADDEPE